MSERTNIEKMESALTSLRPNLIDAPWRVGRLMQACGFTETQLTTPMFDPIEHTPGTTLSDMALDFDRGDYPVIVMGGSRCGKTHQLELARAIYAEAAAEVARPGSTVFSSDVLDQLDAAGCTVEERGDAGIIIHLSAGGEIRGDYAISQMLSRGRLEAHEFRREQMFFPIDKARDVHSGPDYLKHDPTKRHSRKRPTTKGNKRR